MKYAALFAATLAVFSPLFLIGIRKYTGRKAKRALGANIASFFGCLVLATVLGFGGSASAAGLAADTAAAAGGIAEGLKYVGAALAVGLCRLRRPGRHLGKRQGLRQGADLCRPGRGRSPVRSDCSPAAALYLR